MLIIKSQSMLHLLDRDTYYNKQNILDVINIRINIYI